MAESVSPTDPRARDLTYDWSNADDVAVFRKVRDSGTCRIRANTPQACAKDIQRSSRITAASDFAPAYNDTTLAKDVVREGWAYHVSRWPLLFGIGFLILCEFLCYFAVRQAVNAAEFLGSRVGERGRLRQELRKAETYDDWVAAALKLDAHLGLDRWKREAPNAYYDHDLVSKLYARLQSMRAAGNIEGLVAILSVALKHNFSGIDNKHLYSETFYDTKQLINSYLDEVVMCLAEIDASPRLSVDQKLAFFTAASKNMGTSALCLSGGASFGYYHFGVVRALLDAHLLPRIVTGTSAGALVAAFTCTRTDAELAEMLRPELARRITACEESFFTYARRYLATGARFDAGLWAQKASFFTLGSMTFLEAYKRTGRVLNVSVVPYDTHSPTKLLNYITAPDCVIFSAIIASAAVPGILNPVALLTKGSDGRVAPWEFQGKHKDGSLRVDIPLEALHLVYNVNFSIVSQVNPHIHLFHFAPRGEPGRPVWHRRGRGWRGGFFLSALEQFFKLEMSKNFKLLRDLELLPTFASTNWSSIFLQRFEGSVTIFPRSQITDWFKLLSDPDERELARMICVGKQVTWPKIKMIQNRARVEQAVERARAKYERAKGVFSPTRRDSGSDLRGDTSAGSDAAATTAAAAANVPQDLNSDLAALFEKHENNSERRKDNYLTSRRRDEILRELGLDGNSSSTSDGSPNGRPRAPTHYEDFDSDDDQSGMSVYENADDEAESASHSSQPVSPLPASTEADTTASNKSSPATAISSAVKDTGPSLSRRK